MGRVIALLIKFGDDKYIKWQSEKNLFKKDNLPKIVLPFYQKAVEINRRLDLTKIIERIKELENSTE